MKKTFCFNEIIHVIITITSLFLIILYYILVPQEAFAMELDLDIVGENDVLSEDLHNSNNQQNFPLNNRESHSLSFIPDTWLGPLTEAEANGVIIPRCRIKTSSLEFYIEPSINDANVHELYYGPPITSTLIESINNPLLPNTRANHFSFLIPDTWLGPLTEAEVKGVIIPKMMVVSIHPDFYIPPILETIEFGNIYRFFYGPPIKLGEPMFVIKLII